MAKLHQKAHARGGESREDGSLIRWRVGRLLFFVGGGGQATPVGMDGWWAIGPSACGWEDPGLGSCCFYP